ncbi:hypothetical protein ODZ83_05565 [Acaricomes phytoseiuli]|uniref:hypothetical protein n=1 Tax=Acaricomes phytoseiuli TaxID=291968 RepID=UPI002222B2C4|nr:hypothetical protein [Acaricomes phytoseiuli]MCW1249659.1 hypothetical protein [Acaricomes phytoseiuli]
MSSEETETVRFTDPVPAVQEYLSNLFPGVRIASQVPDDGTYSLDELLILVTDAGGGLIKGRVYREKRIGFDVRCALYDTASDAAELVDAAIRGMAGIPRLRFIQNLSAPLFDPDTDLRIPAFTWSAEFFQRGTPITMKGTSWLQD